MTENTTIIDAPPKESHKPNEKKPQQLPPYTVIIEDDDYHTYPYVVQLIQKVFGYAEEKAVNLTVRIDNDGEASVWTGSKEVAELKRELVRSGGPDLYAVKTVKFPLGCRIEPVR